MRLVFEKFEKFLPLRRDALNVVRVEDPSLFSRCALSLAQGFPPDSLEPAYFFNDDGKEIKAAKILYYAGDILAIDLNDRRIVSQAIKTVVDRLAGEGSESSELENLSFQVDEVFEDQFLQMSANYHLSEDWDPAKYLKAMGFAVDEGCDRTLYERLQHFMRIASDLFPDKVIALVNLSNYLTREQYNEFCDLVASLQLCVLSYEQGCQVDLGNLENVIYVDANYLEG